MKRFTLLVFILLLTTFSYSQGHFSKIWSGSGTDQMTIYAIKGSINGMNLQADDEIAAFDETDCVGVTILTAELDDNNYNSMVTIICSSTDAGPKNGFIPGHDIVFKFWDASQSKEITLITPEFVDIQMNSVAAPKFTSNASAFVKLTGAIASDNQAPLAKAGVDQSLNEGVIVTLDGSASSDPDNDALTYLWTAPAGITLSSATVAKPTFTAPEVSQNTDYTFSLVVNDGKVSSAADQVVVTVKQVNKAPIANAGTNQSVNEGALTTLDGSASKDADNDALSFLWTAPEGITLSSTTVAQPTFTAPQVSIDTDYTFSLVVNDGKENSSIAQVVVNVKNVDKLPYISGSLPKVMVDKGSEEKVIDLSSIFADDDSGDFLSYQIQSNTNEQVVHATINEAVLTLVFSSENTGKSEITIEATSNGKSAQLTFEVEVKTPSANEAFKKEPEVQIYPNPTKAAIQINFGGTPAANSWITLYNLAGKEVVKKLAVNQVETISLKGKPEGMYIIKLDQNASKRYKIILEAN